MTDLIKRFLWSLAFNWNWKKACKNESANASKHQRISIDYADKLEEANTEIARQDAVIAKLGEKQPWTFTTPQMEFETRAKYARDNRSKK